MPFAQSYVVWPTLVMYRYPSLSPFDCFSEIGIILPLSILAAYAYGFEIRRNASEAYRMVVYDFGGGTFDITVLEVKGGYFKHLAIDGDIQLGGRDIDQCLRDYAAGEVKRLHQKDLLADKRKAQKLLQLCEQLKKDLTTSESARLVYLSVFLM